MQGIHVSVCLRPWRCLLMVCETPVCRRFMTDRQTAGRTNIQTLIYHKHSNFIKFRKNVFQLLLLLLRGSSIIVVVWVMFTCPVFLGYVFVLLFYCSYLLWYWNMWFLLLICRHEIVWKFVVSSLWILLVCVVIWCFDRINIQVYDCVCESSLFALPPTGLYDRYCLCFVCVLVQLSCRKAQKPMRLCVNFMGVSFLITHTV